MLIPNLTHDQLVMLRQLVATEVEGAEEDRRDAELNDPGREPDASTYVEELERLRETLGEAQ